MTRRPPNRWGALGVAALAGGLIVAQLMAAQTVPEPLATHWSFSGEPNGATPRNVLMALLSAPLGVLALINASTRSPRARVPLTALVYGFSAMFVTLAWSVVSLNRDAPTWQDAGQLPLSHVALVLGSLLIPLGVFFRVHRDYWMLGVAGEPAPPLALRPGERAVWMGSARNRWLWLIALPVAPSLSFTSHMGPLALLWSSLAAVSMLLLADAFSYLRVRVDGRGLCITYGHLGWFEQRVALADISRAETFELVPLEHGGWGYRGSLRWFKRAAVVVRRGAALRVHLSQGRQFAVTVDAPMEGASLLNGLLTQAP